MKKLILSLALILSAVTSHAIDLIDTSAPDELVSVGVRLGLTTSDIKASVPFYGNNFMTNSKTGFATGAVVDLNIRKFFSIQPGFYFYNRSYNYSAVSSSILPASDMDTQIGHTRRYSFTVPILASFHFDLTRILRWNVEIGPYFDFGIGDGKDEVEFRKFDSASSAIDAYTSQLGSRNYYGDNAWQHRKFDSGLQMGTGVELLGHYVFSISYQLGMRNVSAAANNDWSIKNRCWTVALGYNF